MMAPFELHNGECLEVMRGMADNSVDSIVTDPPYELGFMGKAWDASGIANNPAMWAECLRVLKPGGHLLAFSGSRTYHRMTCAIEDAGFEVRDQIMWVYGSGFPKSHNGAWGGTALKPAHEPICVARKPLIGTVAANFAEHGTGGLNIDGCRIGWPEGNAPEIGTPGWGGPAKKLTAVPGQDGETVERAGPHMAGRWPANLIHDGSEEVLAAFPDAPGQMADIRSTAPSAKTSGIYGPMKRENEATQEKRYAAAGGTDFAMKPGARRLDKGSAARFFYCAKAQQDAREAA